MQEKKLQVRWFDGYFEEFDCTEVRFGGYIIWAKLKNGENRTIPVNQVRWFAVYPECHANMQRK